MAFGIDAACSTILGQLLLAASLVEAGRARHVLITGSHLMVRAFPYGHPASPSVGDAATAVVVGPSEEPGILAVHGQSHGEFYDAVAWRRVDGSPWHRGGGDMYVGSFDRPAARQLVRDTVRFGVETVLEVSERARVSPGDIDLFACVQPRRWVPAAIAEGLGLRTGVAPQTFDELAHLGACGVITNLIEGRRRGLTARKTNGAPATVCMYAQGAGFTRAAAIVRWVV
jgi:3-oxoacyl-[acyl-carrier-protein] synthase-3